MKELLNKAREIVNEPNTTVITLIEKLNAEAPEFTTFSHTYAEDYPSGFAGVVGSFDYSCNEISVEVVTSEQTDTPLRLSRKAIDFFLLELGSTMRHEMVHSKQVEEGKDFTGMVAVTQDEGEHYAHPLEVEAYGRADMINEMCLCGRSATHSLYVNLFGRQSVVVTELEDYFHDEADRFYKSVKRDSF